MRLTQRHRADFRKPESTERPRVPALSPDEASIDLLLPTVNRTTELASFLESLAEQTFKNVRVIIVDQNPDGRLEAVLEQSSGRVAVVRVRSEQAMSRAYNVGLPYCEAEVIGFPADDLGYPSDLLELVLGRLVDHPDWDGVSGRTCDERGRPTLLRWDASGGIADRRNIFRRSIGATMFLRRHVIEKVGEFDETLGQRPLPGGGVGGSGEETDYLLRAFAAGFTIGYDPQLQIYHPSYSPRSGDRQAMIKAYTYGLDHTRMLKKHGYATRFVAWRCLQLFGGAAYFLLRGRPGTARFYGAMARGRLRGLLSHA